MNKKTRTLVLTAVLVAITLLFGFTPIGYIPTPFGIVITLMGLPVIIGTLTLGWKAGIALGALFALTSFAKVPTDPLGPTLLEYNALMLAVMIIVPRILMPLTTYGVSRLMRSKKQTVNLIVASIAGTLTNTVLYLSILALGFSGVISDVTIGLILSTALLNGSIEVVINALICPPVVRALRKAVPPLESAKQH